LEKLDREIVTLEIERESLKNEEDTFSQSRLQKVESDLKEKKEDGSRLLSELERRGRFVDEIDSLVGEVTIRNVSVRVYRGCDEGRIGDLDTVVGFEPTLEPTQD
jgi:ATP-dependent Clp protease ATP-binding subunit ClpB